MRRALLLLIALAAGPMARADLFEPSRVPAQFAPSVGLCESALDAETDLEPATRARALGRFRELETALLESGLTSQPAREAAPRLLAFLHDRALRGRYRPDASRLSAALLHGDYNCLSATLLYAALAERIDLPVGGVVWPGHVACRVSGEAGSIDVEPTCREWFLAPDSATRDALRRGALAAIGQPFNPAESRCVDRRQLVALTYFNLGTQRLQANQPAAATEALERAWALDPGSAAIRANLLAALNNQAVALQRQGAADAARALLRRCRQIAPEDRLTVENLARLAP